MTPIAWAILVAILFLLLSVYMLDLWMVSSLQYCYVCIWEPEEFRQGLRYARAYF